MIKTQFKKSVDDDSYVLSFEKDRRYADIEFFDTGEILTGQMGGKDPACIKDVTKENIFDVITELIEFINES